MKKENDLPKSLTDGNVIDAVLLTEPLVVALLIDAGDDLYTRIRIPQNNVKEAQEFIKQCLNTYPIEHYLRKFNEKRVQLNNLIVDKIKMVESLNDKGLLKSDIIKYSFKWSLVMQECEMYCLIGEEVDRKDFNFVCKRRGFDEDMKEVVIDTMKYVGLGDKL